MSGPAVSSTLEFLMPSIFGRPSSPLAPLVAPKPELVDPIEALRSMMEDCYRAAYPTVEPERIEALIADAFMRAG
jgi:hypothetical protein